MFRLTSLSAAALILWVGAATAATGDVDAGEKLFSQCKSCHQIGEGAENRIGPQLNRLFGRVAGTQDGFRYSKRFVLAGTGGLEWHADTLDTFLENPKSLVSGTRMSFPGMKDADDRQNLIAYLRTFSDNPSDIPEADPTATSLSHDLDPEILALVGDPEYGEYLSGECKTCHQEAGGDAGIPSIVLWPEEDFVVALHAYKNKERNHPVMQMIAGRLGDEEIAALAAYFANLETE
ncbi:MAG: c-type cytochrome [Silicimonas sp.]|nr:c-type cytochrome [Silicimonas sp.]